MLISVLGAYGRMGKEIRKKIRSAPDLTLCDAIDRRGRGTARSLREVRTVPDILVDFSSHESCKEAVSFCLFHHIPLVCGTTGHSAEELRFLQKACAEIPVFYAENFSKGAELLRIFAKSAAILFDADDAVLLEAHHKGKKDSPSGTANRIAKDINDASSALTLQIHSIRVGEISGMHEISFFGTDEILTLRHRSTGLSPFASGALQAARYLFGKEPGLYTMHDLLLSEKEIMRS